MDAFIDQLWIARWAIAAGLLYTVQISLASIVIGSLIGTFIGLGLTFGAWPVRLVCRLYTDFVRGTPVLVLILATFYILAVFGLQLTAMQAGILALAVFCGAHVGEMLRGALQAIPPGQVEAARSIGLTFRQIFVYVLAPQALRQVIPTWINTAAELVKASTLLSIIGVSELLLVTQEVISRNYLSLEFYGFAGLLYFLVNFAIERLGKAVDRRLAY
jgi:polar amino acid transport system permease protein